MIDPKIWLAEEHVKKCDFCQEWCNTFIDCLKLMTEHLIEETSID